MCPSYQVGFCLMRNTIHSLNGKLVSANFRQMLYSAIKNMHDTAKVQDELLSVDLYLDQVEVRYYR